MHIRSWNSGWAQLFLLWVSQTKSRCWPAQAVFWRPWGVTASKLIDVGGLHSLAAIGLRSVSGNLSELPEAACIPHHVPPSIFNQQWRMGFCSYLEFLWLFSTLSLSLHSEEGFCLKDSWLHWFPTSLSLVWSRIVSLSSCQLILN